MSFKKNLFKKRPDNIFLDENKNIKIGDFGLASLENLKLTHQSSAESSEVYSHSETFEQHNNLSSNLPNINMRRVKSFNIGTPLYTSPEQEKGGDYNAKTDIYSLGLILFEMLAAFSTNHERYLSFKQIRDKGKLPENFKQKFEVETDLIMKIVHKNADNRHDTKEVIKIIDTILSKLD